VTVYYAIVTYQGLKGQEKAYEPNTGWGPGELTYDEANRKGLSAANVVRNSGNTNVSYRVVSVQWPADPNDPTKPDYLADFRANLN
jgi:hypothetical protein